MIFVDSSVWIDYFNGTPAWQSDALDEMLERDIIIIGDYVLAEVLQGFRTDKDYAKAKAMLEFFPCYDICGIAVAIKSAEHFRYLRKRGITVRKTIDVIIATFCIQNNLILLHNDKDFFPFERFLDLKTVKKN